MIVEEYSSTTLITWHKNKRSFHEDNFWYIKKDCDICKDFRKTYQKFCKMPKIHCSILISVLVLWMPYGTNNTTFFVQLHNDVKLAFAIENEMSAWGHWRSIKEVDITFTKIAIVLWGQTNAVVGKFSIMMELRNNWLRELRDKPQYLSLLSILQYCRIKMQY